MIRLILFMMLSSMLVLMAGCDGSKDKRGVWEDTKLIDLAPSDVKRLEGQALKTVNFDVYYFELPSEKISSLENVWQLVHTEPIRLADEGGFADNSFSAGLGQFSAWGDILKMLADSGGKRIETVSMLLLEGARDAFAVAALREKKTVFYISKKGSMEGATLGPGRLGLEISTERVTAARGVCKFSAQPVFISRSRASMRRAKNGKTDGRFVFGSVGFSSKMSPGEFIVLGPKEYSTDRVTLGSLFFSRSLHKPSVRVYLILCTGMNY